MEALVGLGSGLTGLGWDKDGSDVETLRPRAAEGSREDREANTKAGLTITHTCK